MPRWMPSRGPGTPRTSVSHHMALPRRCAAVSRPPTSALAISPGGCGRQTNSSLSSTRGCRDPARRSGPGAPAPPRAAPASGQSRSRPAIGARAGADCRVDDDPTWAAVDDYWSGALLAPDPVLDAAIEANAAGGLPAIDVSPAQGKLLHLLARSIGARRILEVGTLGGYSTIWLARALPADGELITCELVPGARRGGPGEPGPGRAGRDGRGAGRAGRGHSRRADRPVRPGVHRRRQGLQRRPTSSRRCGCPGPARVIVVDNVVRGGAVVDAGQRRPAVLGTRQLAELLRADDRLDATVIQTVGRKGYDGFLYALVRPAMTRRASCPVGGPELGELGGGRGGGRAAPGDRERGRGVGRARAAATGRGRTATRPGTPRCACRRRRWCPPGRTGSAGTAPAPPRPRPARTRRRRCGPARPGGSDRPGRPRPAPGSARPVISVASRALAEHPVRPGQQRWPARAGWAAGASGPGSRHDQHPGRQPRQPVQQRRPADRVQQSVPGDRHRVTGDRPDRGQLVGGRPGHRVRAADQRALALPVHDHHHDPGVGGPGPAGQHADPGLGAARARIRSANGPGAVRAGVVDRHPLPGRRQPSG